MILCQQTKLWHDYDKDGNIPCGARETMVNSRAFQRVMMKLYGLHSSSAYHCSPVGNGDT